MLLKKGVRIVGVKPEIILGIMVVDQIYKDLGHTSGVVVTSIMDGRHSKNSRHYIGLAVDFRTHGVADVPSLASKIKDALPEFYIQVEHLGEPNEHIHAQFNGSYV